MTPPCLAPIIDIPSHPPTPAYTSPGLRAFLTDATGGTSPATVTASTGSSSTTAAASSFSAKYVFDDEIIRYVSVENRLKGATNGGSSIAGIQTIHTS